MVNNNEEINSLAKRAMKRLKKFKRALDGDSDELMNVMLENEMIDQEQLDDYHAIKAAFGEG